MIWRGECEKSTSNSDESARISVSALLPLSEAVRNNDPVKDVGENQAERSTPSSCGSHSKSTN